MGNGLHNRTRRWQRPGANPGGRPAPLQGALAALSGVADGRLDEAGWRRAWIAYAIAHVGKSLLWTASDLLTLYLLVSVYAIDPIVAGTLFLVGLAANAGADLGVGLWLEKRPRDAAALAAIALVLAAVSFPATVLLARYGPWALLAATLAFRVSYAGCDVPHNALLIRLGSDPARATWMARGRTIGTALASLLAARAASGDVVAIAPWLCCIAVAALVVGSAMVPLLAAFPIDPGPRRSGTAIGLPLPFLAASIIGIVALGALAKAVLHLPAQAGGTSVLLLLIAGRTLSAFIPIRIGSPRRGLTLLAAAYAAAAVVAAGFAFGTAPGMLVLLGLSLGATNLVGWALLPAMADGPGAYGLYTMASKLALGAVGLALAGGLGRSPAFSPAAFAEFVWVVVAACIVAALLAGLRLTSTAVRRF